MKLIIPNIVWHGDRERILAVAFHPQLNLFMTGGSDSEKRLEEQEESLEDSGYIKLWELSGYQQLQLSVRFVGALSGGHTSSVNCLKFSPNGQYLASGSDDKKIIIWERRMRQRMGTSESRLTWCETKPLLGHIQEVYDLCWSRDGNYLVSGSLDNNVIVWHVEKGKMLQTLDGHTSYVQGVVFDPKMKFIVSLSQDRSGRVWKSTKSKKLIQYYGAYVIRKMELKEKVEEEGRQQQNFKLFLDENMLFTFVRRPDWSPDGSFFILPTAQCMRNVNEKPQMGAYLFMRSLPQVPALFIPTGSKPSIVVRFCPVIFRKQNPQMLIDLEYKMVFAIATIDQVILYSTESIEPIAIFGNMHYASITDMVWKEDQLLAISSCDGFCSFIQFSRNELGEELPKEEYTEELRQLLPTPMEEKRSPSPNIIMMEQEQKVEVTEQNGVMKKKIVPRIIGQL